MAYDTIEHVHISLMQFTRSLWVSKYYYYYLVAYKYQENILGITCMILSNNINCSINYLLLYERVFNYVFVLYIFNKAKKIYPYCDFHRVNSWFQLSTYIRLLCLTQINNLPNAIPKRIKICPSRWNSFRCVKSRETAQYISI